MVKWWGCRGAVGVRVVVMLWLVGFNVMVMSLWW